MQVTAQVLYRTEPGHPKPWTRIVSITTVIDTSTPMPAAAIWLAEQIRADWVGEGPGHYRLVGPPAPRWFTEGDAIVLGELETTLVSTPLGWDITSSIGGDDIDSTGAGATAEPVEVHTI